VGRIDHQVKIRGFRVETAEIELALMEHAAVRNAVVTVDEGESDSPEEGVELSLYFVTVEGELIANELVRQHLQARLPSYMMPARIVHLEAFPLNRNGKIDRAALPRSDDEGGEEAGAAYEAPRTPTERVICGIWQDVMNLPRVGIQDDFFEMGGHSIQASRIISRAREEFGIDLAVGILFDLPTPAELAAAVDERVEV
jgi:hypothetical protein